ncbi:hypothetical protein D3C76_1372660 [compost metagenome]
MFSLHISSAKGHAMSVKFRRWSQHVATGHPKKNPQGPGSPFEPEVMPWWCVKAQPMFSAAT